MFNQFINASGTIENDIEMNRLVTLTVSLPFTKKKKKLSPSLGHLYPWKPYLPS